MYLVSSIVPPFCDAELRVQTYVRDDSTGQVITFESWIVTEVRYLRVVNNFLTYSLSVFTRFFAIDGSTFKVRSGKNESTRLRSSARGPHSGPKTTSSRINGGNPVSDRRLT